LSLYIISTKIDPIREQNVNNLQMLCTRACTKIRISKKSRDFLVISTREKILFSQKRKKTGQKQDKTRIYGAKGPCLKL
jgi:hypothetical protein